VSKLNHITTHDGVHYGYGFWCPGCKDVHVITTQPYPGGWTFNGNEESPAFGPSIHVHQVKREDGTVFSPACHSFVENGRIRYLGDCGHELANRVVDLLDWKGWNAEDYA
jgi:hypothetical protein